MALTVRSILTAAVALVPLSCAGPSGASQRPVDPAPTRAVGYSDDFEYFHFFETATGDVYADAGVASTRRFAASPVRDELYFDDLGEPDGTESIRRMQMGGSHSDFVVEGGNPAVSGTGRYLAYSFDPDHAKVGPREGVAVRDLDAGTERRFPNPTPAEAPGGLGEHVISGMAVSRDGRYVAFSYEDRGEILVLDVTTAETLGDARAVLTPTDEYSPYAHPVFLADGRVAAAEIYRAVVAVDPATGDTASAVDVVSAPDPFETIASLDVDDTGRHLLVGLAAVHDTTPRYVTYSLPRDNRRTEPAVVEFSVHGAQW